MNAHMDPSATQFLNSQPPLSENEQMSVDQSLSSENSNIGFSQSQTSMPQSNMYFSSNQFPTSNLHFQSHYGLNRVNAPYPPHAQQVYGPGYGFQGLLNTPIFPFESQTSGSSKGSKKKVIQSKNKKDSQTIDVARKSRVWTIAEDTSLAKAYLYISIDSIVGKDQTSEKMWSRIFKVWKEHMGLPEQMSQNNNEGRNINALSCHWGVIQAAVNKFHGLYEALERTPRSGTNADDVKEQALRMYRETGDGSEFRFIHCWEIMRSSAKWCSLQLTKSGSTKRHRVDDRSSEIPAPSTPIIPGFSTPQEDEVSGLDNPTTGNTNAGSDRPLGRRQSKDHKKKKMQEEKIVMDTLNNFKITLEKEFELREQAVKKDIEMKEKSQKLKEEAEKRRRKEKQRKEDLAILNTDLDKLQPTLRVALRLRQAVILKELQEDGFFGDNRVNIDLEN